MHPPDTKPQVNEDNISHDLREITELLIKHHRLHKGFFDLSLQFQIAVGGIGAMNSTIPGPLEVSPGVIIGVKKIGLSKTDVLGPSTVDAAEVNPKPLSKKAAMAIKKPLPKKKKIAPSKNLKSKSPQES